jgi:hypothetical protein
MDVFGKKTGRQHHQTRGTHSIGIEFVSVYGSTDMMNPYFE